MIVQPFSALSLSLANAHYVIQLYLCTDYMLSGILLLNTEWSIWWCQIHAFPSGNPNCNELRIWGPIIILQISNWFLDCSLIIVHDSLQLIVQKPDGESYKKPFL